MPPRVNVLKKKIKKEMEKFELVGDFPSINTSSEILVKESSLTCDRELKKIVRGPDIYGGKVNNAI